MSNKQWGIAGVILLNLFLLAGYYLYRRSEDQAAENRAAAAAGSGAQFNPNTVIPAAHPPDVGDPSSVPADPAASREAAYRSQSKNNLRTLALALHNYASAKNGFPAGVHPHPTLPLEKRISWIADVLPYLDQNGAFQSVDFTKAWDDPVHERLTKLDLNLLHTPAPAEGVTIPPGFTQYVGMGGVGEDAPSLPVADPRAGAFGFNKPRTIADFRDGMSNTILVTEASSNFGPWIAGGPATIRSLTKKPYINGPDGIGGPFKGGVHAAMGDGSVRFISENIDPKIFEALSTINGGEPIPQ